MLEQNTSRVYLTLGGIMLLGAVIFALNEFFPEIRQVIDQNISDKPGSY